MTESLKESAGEEPPKNEANGGSRKEDRDGIRKEPKNGKEDKETKEDKEKPKEGPKNSKEEKEDKEIKEEPKEEPKEPKKDKEDLQQKANKEKPKEPIESKEDNSTSNETHTTRNIAEVRNRSSTSSSYSLNETAGISFLKDTLEKLISIKEIAKKQKDLVKSAQDAIATLKSGEIPPEAKIFEPLKRACEQKNISGRILALDCLGKIFTFNIFNSSVYVEYQRSKPSVRTDAELETNVETVPSSDSGNKIPLIEAVIEVISSCFDGEGTDERVELQIIRVLTAAIVNKSMPVHGKALLQAVRQLYNIFLLSLSPVNQGIAQATLMQVVNLVFDNVNSAVEKEDRADAQKRRRDKQKKEKGEERDEEKEEDKEKEKGEGEEEERDDQDDRDSNTHLTLQQMQNVSNDVVRLSSEETFSDETEVWTRDAFLILRSMCNLSAKTIENESVDMRSHAMRSKLISLYIVYFTVRNNLHLFTSSHCTISSRRGTAKTSFVDAIKKHICLVLSRNSSSQVGPVYELTLEIFWLITSRLRSQFKYEIPVFFDEVYFPISQIATSTPHQKRYLLDVVSRRLCRNSKALIELYLNYDCNTSMPNLSEEVVNLLTRHALARVDATPVQRVAYKESMTRNLATYSLDTIPELNTNRLTSRAPVPEADAKYPVAYALKMCAIDGLVSFLQCLDACCGEPIANINSKKSKSNEDASIVSSSMADDRSSVISGQSSSTNTTNNTTSTPLRFESIKQKKTAFLECVRQFQFSPKRGVKAFIKSRFLGDSRPETIAKFLYETDALDKSAIGEYLGEGQDLNVAIMHAFVDLMDFQRLPFLDALREFLQHFRLPGESQKIDRFMLKFAEKYVNDNPGTFANADTVYVLSYSVVMLNTDLHSPQVKQRMTLDEFVKNNRGIDDGHDLDPELLGQIYHDIQSHEIILKSERQRAAIHGKLLDSQQANGNAGMAAGTGASGSGEYFNAGMSNFSLFGVNRGLAKEAYLRASREMTSNTERAVQSLVSSSKQDAKHFVFYSLNDSEEEGKDTAEYVRSMYENLWMSFLAGLTPPFKEYDDGDTAKLLLLGIKLSIHLACVLGIDYARTSFVRALVQFTSINNQEDMKEKNVEAILTVLDIAIADQNSLKSSWRFVFIVISQVERLKLLSRGIDSGAVPDLLNARLANRESLDTTQSQNSATANGSANASGANNGASSGFFSFGKQPSISEQAFQKHTNQKMSVETAMLLNSTQIDVAIDQVFAKSAKINGDAIFDFLAGLSEVAKEEIDSSGESKEPRMFSLQKLVDVCYYNMGRIRVQWSALWVVLNETFSEFGCHSNPAVCFFAIDSLRQMAERFFDIEELAHFKFQKDFLQPFNYVITHNSNLKVRDMVLDCVQYLVAKKAASIRSGWSSLLGVLTNAAVDDDEQFVTKGYKYVSVICKNHFDEVFAEEGFEAVVVCLTEYAKNDKFQKISLHALHDISALVNVINSKTEADVEETDGTAAFGVIKQASLTKFWFPLLYGFHDVIMEGEDLEVRAQALDDLFNTLVKYGKSFGKAFWYRVSEEILFPIFGILSQHWQLSTNQEDLWVWLSSTLIQALRRMIGLFTTFYSTLSGMLDGYLNLLVSCICQENETISKVGISCLQDLLLQNMTRFGAPEWTQIDATFAKLFALTRATELFDADPNRQQSTKSADGIVPDLSSQTPVIPSLTISPSTTISGESDDGENGDNEENNESGDNDDDENTGSADTEEEEEDDALNALRISRQKSTIVIKCVLQLHMIQTLSELFDNEKFYASIPVADLLKLAELLYQSYKFAKDFNEDYNLRVRLWNSGVTDKLPNLLKQETSAVGVFISITFRMYSDEDKTDLKTRKSISSRLMPLSVALLRRYAAFNEQEQARSVQNWVPVVVETVQACTEMDDDDFREVCPMIYNYILAIFDKSLDQNLRLSLHDFFARVGSLYLGVAVNQKPRN